MDAKIKNKLVKNKSGQVTIFVIIAIIIVAAVLLYLMLRKDVGPSSPGGQEANPESFLDSCLKESLRENIDLINFQGGYADPELYKTFLIEEDGSMSKISYLCYTENYGKPCVNQAPILLGHVEEEIKNSIENDVYDCVSMLGQNFRKDDYTVSVKYVPGNFQVTIEPERVRLNINAEISLTKKGESSIQKDFVSRFATKTYSLLMVTQEAINKEAGSVDCEFNYIDYQTLYPDYKIRKYNGHNGTEIYRIENKDDGEIFRFAVRGCVIP
jgi:hypothetical protein